MFRSAILVGLDAQLASSSCSWALISGSSRKVAVPMVVHRQPSANPSWMKATDAPNTWPALELTPVVVQHQRERGSRVASLSCRLSERDAIANREI